MDVNVVYPPKYFAINPNTGILAPKKERNQVTQVYAFEEETCYYNGTSHTSSVSSSTSIWTKLLCAACIFFGLCFLAAAIIIPLYVVPALTKTIIIRESSGTLSTSIVTNYLSSMTTTTTTIVTWFSPSRPLSCGDNCISVSTVTPATLLASWQFENNLFDSTSNYHGLMRNGTTYIPGYVNQAVFLNSSQYVASNASFLNLTYRSFTIEAWIYLTALNVSYDTGIFAQCHNFTTRHCLHFVIRARKVYMGFLYDDVTGATNVSLNTWTHVAFVYDMTMNSQGIYLNGILDGYNVSTGPYLGSSGTLFIGYTNHSVTANALTGYIDHVTVTNRAKSTCEIFNDATLVARFSFDDTMVDIGPNNLTVYSVIQSKNGLSYTSGRVNRALLMSSATSAFFQACGFFSLGQSDHPFTFALWINPTVPLGTVLHLSADRSGSAGWCLPMLGFSSNGSIVAQSWDGTAVSSVFGPQIPSSNWTHIAQTWSSTNGIQLYVNGDLYGSARMFKYIGSNQVDMCIFLGTSGFGSNCATEYIDMGSYAGAVDEFYVYNRELSSDEICSLAVP